MTAEPASGNVETAPAANIPADVIESIRTLLRWIGEDPDREGLRETPGRVAKSLRASLSGYRTEILFDVRRRADGGADPSEIIIIPSAPFETVRETDLARVTGLASVAYLPDILIAEPAALERALATIARRLQTQEQLTADFAQAIRERLSPKGVAVIIETGQVDFVTGVAAADLAMTTCIMLGCFKDNPEMRRSVTALIGSGGLALRTRIADRSNRRRGFPSAGGDTQVGAR